MTLTRKKLAQIVRVVEATRADEIDCRTCFEQMDRFAEETLAGHQVAEAMPLVEDHLQRCPECREAFEALLDALHALV